MAQDKLKMIYGIRPVIEALRSGKQLEKLFVQKGLKGTLVDELRSMLKEFHVEMQYVPGEKLNRLTLKNHQGVVAYLSNITYQKIEDIIPLLYENGKVPFVLILDRITDVRNFGAIARTAECVGVNAIIIPSKGAAMINADAIKTSAGALNHIPVVRSNNLKDIMKFLSESGVKLVAATEKASMLYTNPDYKVPIGIVMGSEEDGISQAILKRSDYLVKLPMHGNTGSLNVSVAAGVLMYEVLNQRLSENS